LSSFGVWLLEADESMPDNNESDVSKEVESECADKEKHDVLLSFVGGASS